MARCGSDVIGNVWQWNGAETKRFEMQRRGEAGMRSDLQRQGADETRIE